MAINVAAIRDLLLPGLRGVTGEYKQWPAIWPKLFDQGKSEMAQERTASMRFLPLAQLKQDGGQTFFDNNAGEAFVYNQLHVGIGLGYAIPGNVRVAPINDINARIIKRLTTTARFAITPAKP